MPSVTRRCKKKTMHSRGNGSICASMRIASGETAQAQAAERGQMTGFWARGFAHQRSATASSLRCHLRMRSARRSGSLQRSLCPLRLVCAGRSVLVGELHREAAGWDYTEKRSLAQCAELLLERSPAPSVCKQCELRIRRFSNGTRWRELVFPLRNKNCL